MSHEPATEEPDRPEITISGARPPHGRHARGDVRPEVATSDPPPDRTALPEEGESSSPMEPVPMEPVAPPQRRSRAGRNLSAAIGVGLGLGALILLSLYLVKGVFLGVVALAVLLGLWELSNALGSGQVRVPLVPVGVGAVAILVAAYAGGPEAMTAALALTLLATMVWRLPEHPSGYIRDTTAGVFVTMYVPFLAGFAALLLRSDDGADRVVTFIVLVVLSDVGGYAAGVLFGRHPMAPTVSPKKSWEGFAGSGLFSAVGGAIMLPVLLDGPAAAGALIGLAVMLTATLGDLGESMIKRDLGIKDMGSLLPGHGGIMDRLDSLLPAAPVTYLLLAWIVGP
ncbi:MAG: phosphatidate cytidylyltransferase [Actinomycetota bacterium]|jgi:phosphatidate cytidylyltransferase|nr:phosphatidate cytidylyltransferase [Actinomycetota bacterium]